MNLSDGSAGAAVALTLCDPAWVPDLAARLREPLLDALARAPHLPPELVRRLPASAGPEAHAALARDTLARETALTADVATEHAARTPGFLRSPAARELIRRVRTRLDHADAWVVAVRLLPEFTGTLLELVDTAATATGHSIPAP
ncbi:hypothetical protein ACFZBU_47090 [Embleya sp. NPDC008237]|uniref:hypothetical protein n=1 Tax=Embleya sp. NPDC008237 TaxID=3363978 RepID=UPI0036E78F91